MHFGNKVVVRTDIPTHLVASYTIVAKRLDGWRRHLVRKYRPPRRQNCIRLVLTAPRKGHSTPPPLGPCPLWPRSPISATAELLLYTAIIDGNNYNVNLRTSSYRGTARRQRWNVEMTSFNPIQSNVFWRAPVVLFAASYIDYDHIKTGTLPVPVKSALKSKGTSWLDQCLWSLYLKALTVSTSTTSFGKLFQIFTTRAQN